MVSNAEYIRVIYHSYFDKADAIMDKVKRIRQTFESSKSLSVEDRIKAEHLITSIEEQLVSFAQNLSRTGIEIVKRCS